MIVTRQCEEIRSPWSSSKLEAIYHRATSPRMSTFESLQTQQDWREQYSSFSPPAESGLLQPNFGHAASSNDSNSHPNELQDGARPPLEQRQNLGSLELQQDAPAVLTEDRPGSAPGDYEHSLDHSIRDDSHVSTDSTALSLASNPLSSVSSAPMHPGTDSSNGEEATSHSHVKVEEEDDEEVDEILEADEGLPQTAAERRAERRKMKRFRLTHQQTRFLMSEFAKQAHPDAAHRERLSREIPGLSPRQVQVWFQNRRAKIKRLTADDRERMMKMRAVPDDFDNVQALHSPYGAVQGLGTPLQSPVDFAQPFADGLMRPLMVDTMRRHDTDEHLSPSGLTPAFGHVGFASPGAMSSPDVLSPLSLNSTDRYFSNHLSGSLAGGPRSANPFDRQASTVDYQSLSNSRQSVRPLQPLHLRDTIARTRPESLQSPLRTSVSWKGDSLNYFQGNNQVSPQLGATQQSMYQNDHLSNSTVNANQFDGNTYSGTSIQTSPAHVPYSPSHGSSSSLQQTSTSSMSRLRAASVAFPTGLDFRNQYRGLSGQQTSPRNMTTHRSNSFGATFTTSFASAPLTAPVDFSLPRTTAEAVSTTRDFPISQLSAPMAPPQDFMSAYGSSLSPGRAGQTAFGNSARTGTDQEGQRQARIDGQQSQTRIKEESTFSSSLDYSLGQKRKRGFTIPGSFQGPS